MKLAVVGNEGKTTRSVILHGKKQGYQIVAPRRSKNNALSIAFDAGGSAMAAAIKKADAVLCILHEGHRVLDESSHEAIRRLVDAMLAGNARRLVLFSLMPKDHAAHFDRRNKSVAGRVRSFFKREARQAKNALDVLRSSGLDWTIIGWPQDGPSVPKALGKHMINQLTDVSNLRRVFMLPSSDSEQTTD